MKEFKIETPFRVGDKVVSLYCDNIGDTGTIVELNTHRNSKKQYCHRVSWTKDRSWNERNFHPNFLRKLTKLEQML